jgi:hypothetical protein
VPEKVPFRMTPNIRTALGVTGVEVSVIMFNFVAFHWWSVCIPSVFMFAFLTSTGLKDQPQLQFSLFRCAF